MLASAGAATLGWSQASAQRASPPRIVVSFSVLADMARSVAPTDAHVTSLVGPDADAHVFEPTPADGRRLAQADVVVINGLGFEGWMERLVKVSGFRGPVVVAAPTPVARPSTRLAREVDDPHAWQDLALGRRYVATMRDAFVHRWPDRHAEISARSAAYDALLATLHQRVVTRFAAIPRPLRRVVTTHQAFGHFGAAYGVDFLAAQGWNNQGEPSAAAVARLIRQIRQARATALFVENISSRRLMDRIASESGARVGGTLYSDALSHTDGPAATYLAMFEHNASTLLAAMQRGDDAATR